MYNVSHVTDSPDSIRLNKHLALQLGVSRREADEMIESGRVAVNGQTAVLGTRFTEGDEVITDGATLSQSPRECIYLAFHKPTGYVCSRRAQGDNPTIYDLIPEQYHHLKPVGRLDRDSSGILLLTNDGDFAHQMTHPSFYKAKVYEALLDHDLEPLHQQMISDFGIDLEDGKSQLSLMKLDETDRSSWQVTMHEGRNRQIRRTFAALGYTVIGLHRVQFGNYSLGDIPRGELRPITIS